MIHERTRWLVVTTTALVALLASSCSSAPTRGTGAPHRSVAKAHSSRGFARYVGATAPSARVELSLVLRLPDRRALDRYLAELYDPRSPSYRHFLSPAEFGRRFGAPAAAVARVRRWLERAGMHVTRVFPQHTSVEARATASQIAAAFGVRLADYRDRSGRVFRMAVGDPVVPPAVRGAVEAVAGLNGAAAPVLSDIPEEGLKPIDAARAYDITPLQQLGLQGQGETIAIIGLGRARDREVAMFDRLTGTTGPPVEHIPVLGGTTDTTGPGAGEANLDVDVIRGIAPKAQILSYEFSIRRVQSFVGRLSHTVDRVVADGRAKIASISLGACDVPMLTPSIPWIQSADRLRANRAFQAAAVAGVNVFVSSGDDGAYECAAFIPHDDRLATSWPGDLPSVVSVGGTNLSVRQDGTYLEEAGWEDVFSGTGTGGGLNPLDPRPSWQVGAGVENVHSNGRRQVPDVSAASDPDSGFFVVLPDGPDSTTGKVGGTSAAAPFWAASMLLIQQYAKRQGVPRLGFIAPVLYQVAANQNPAAPAFHDVTIGGNRYYNCTPGWDYATGLGSPDVFNLAKAVVAYLKQRPA